MSQERMRFSQRMGIGRVFSKSFPVFWSSAVFVKPRKGKKKLDEVFCRDSSIRRGRLKEDEFLRFLLYFIPQIDSS